MYKNICLITVLLMALLFTGCSHTKTVKAPSKEVVLTQAQEKEADLSFAKVQEELMDVIITIPAEFKAILNLSSKIYMPVDGKVKDVLVEQGQIVKKGQALAIIQSDYLGQIQSEVLQNLIQNDADIKMAGSELTLSKHAFEREKFLLDKKITSVAEYEMAKKQFEQAQINLNSQIIKKNATISVYKQRLAMYGCDTTSINKLLATRKIYPYLTARASKDGIVLSRSVNPDEFVFANNEMFQVADLSKIWLVGNVFDKDIANVKVGDKITAQSEDLYNVQGVVTYVAPQINLETRALEIRAEVDNKDCLIKPNLYAKMSIITGSKQALVVPVSAVQKYGESNLIFVRSKPYTYVEKIVEIGEKNDKYAEIKSGLSKDDEVVTNGSFYVLGEHIKKMEGEL